MKCERRTSVPFSFFVIYTCHSGNWIVFFHNLKFCALQSSAVLIRLDEEKEKKMSRRKTAQTICNALFMCILKIHMMLWQPKTTFYLPTNFYIFTETGRCTTAIIKLTRKNYRKRRAAVAEAAAYFSIFSTLLIWLAKKEFLVCISYSTNKFTLFMHVIAFGNMFNHKYIMYYDFIFGFFILFVGFFCECENFSNDQIVWMSVLTSSDFLFIWIFKWHKHMLSKSFTKHHQTIPKKRNEKNICFASGTDIIKNYNQKFLCNIISMWIE